MSGLCGWAGYTADEESRRKLLARMADALSAHDGSDVSTRCSVGCGIAIASLHGNAAVHEEGDLHVAIAGHPVWNDRELADLAAREGHAKALAAAYAAKGPRLLDILGGRFALAVVREGEWQALLATDRFGTVPLDYAFRHGCLVFGTHGEALQAHPRAESEIDPQALFGYFFQSAVAAPATVRKHHRRLLPGHRLLLKGGKITVEHYFRQAITEERRPLPEAEEEFRTLVEQAVERAAKGAEVGAFLSGGTDSSTVAGMLTKVLGRPARTYSMGFMAEGFDEMEYARCAAQHFGTDHHEIIVRPDVATLLPRLIWHMDEPLADSAIITTFLVAEFARRDVTVILSGVGGDELLGGYRRYLGGHYLGQFNRLPRWLREGCLLPLARRLPSDRHGPVTNLLRYAREFISHSTLPAEEQYIAYVRLFDAATRIGLAAQALPRPLEDPLLAAFARATGTDAVNRLMQVDLETQLPDDLLLLTDKMTMAASLECRVPLLGNELLDLSLGLPSALKMPGSRLKQLFKAAVADLLPAATLEKSKRGFGAPMGAWLKKELRPLMDVVLSEQALRRRGLFDPQAVRGLMAEHSAARQDYSDHLQCLMNLEIWCRIFLDGESPADVAGELAGQVRATAAA